MVAIHLDSVLILVGEVNRLKLNWFAADNGLSRIVNAATRGVNTLDVHFTSQTRLFKCSVVSASVFSDHRALIIRGIYIGMIFDVAKLKRRKNCTLL
jgi:hypothetical protein